MSEGLFQDRLRASGADVVTDPLGTHPGVARLLANRFQRAGFDTNAEMAFQERNFENLPAGMRFRR